MARGWESKAVEDQISASEIKQETRAKRRLTDLEIKQQKQKEGLLLERVRIMREMEQGHKRRYLTLLERSLNHIEAQLLKLEQGS